MLKNIILITGLSLLMVSNIFSQNLGVKIGGVYSNFTTGQAPATYSTTTDPGGKLGFQLGIYTQFKIVNKLYIQPELLFTTKGYTGASLSYFELPVLIKYKVVKELAIGAGPGISYLAGSGILVPENKLDLGINLDLSYTIARKIDIGLRYNYGLIRVLDIQYVDINGQPIVSAGLRNYTFTIYAGYKFEFRKK